MHSRSCAAALAAAALALAACADSTAPTRLPADLPDHPATTASPVQVRPDHYIVLLEDGAPDVRGFARQLSLRHLGQIEHTYEHALKGFSVKMSAAQAQALAADPGVARVDPDVYVHQAGDQLNPGWALDRMDERDRPLDGDYSYAATGDGVSIYIIDEGIRYSHDEFGGRARLGYDAYGGSGGDCNGHGTGVAAAAAGRTYGAAKSAAIYSVRVLDCDGSGTLSAIIAGVDWVTAHHRWPAVANMSLTSTPPQPLLDLAVQNSIASGVTYVAAAGNYGSDACGYSPGHMSDVIAVGATDGSDRRASWSDWGSCVDIFAPGVWVNSADYFSDQSTATWSGTSFAAPLVAGVAAAYLQTNPDASPSQVKSAILSNATTGRVSDLAGSADRLVYTGFIGGGGGSSPSTPPPPPPSGGGSAIQTLLAPGKCLDVQGASQSPGSRAIIWPCKGSVNQEWTFTAAGEIRVYGSMCLDDARGFGEDGDAIVIWPCKGSSNQQWKLTSDGSIVGINGKCVDVARGDPSDGTPLVLWTCKGSQNQQWSRG